MRIISKNIHKIVRLPIILLLAISISLAILPAAGYELVVPGDQDGDMIVSDEELETAQSSYDDGKITSEELEMIEHINENYPRTITDTAGREVTLYKPAERIITREPDTCRIVIALGEGEKVVASEQAVKSCLCPTTFETFEEGCLSCYSTILGGNLPDLPETSTRYDIYYEQMASLIPDVIITSSTTDAQEFENKVGCPMVVASGSGWLYDYEGGLYGQIEVIGDLLERDDEADELIGFIESKVQMVRSVTDGLDEDEKPKVYFAPRGATLGFYDPKEGRDFTRTVNSYDPLSIAGGIDAGREAVSPHEGVGDDPARSRRQDPLRDEGVGVGDVGDLQVSDDRRHRGDLLDDVEPCRQDQGVADFDVVDPVLQGRDEVEGFVLGKDVEGEDEAGVSDHVFEVYLQDIYLFDFRLQPFFPVALKKV
jgi:ABC-type Fe3+-hydroxamate transport system substrate-binding protein